MMRRQSSRETVLYYAPEGTAHVAKLKGVLVRMGIRIRNVSADQIQETVGHLAGVPGFDGQAPAGRQRDGKPAGITETQANGESAAVFPKITEEVLVLHHFSGQRIDELLLNLRKAGVPKIDLKAIVTDHNCAWTFYHLYEEIKDEHEKMQKISQ